MGKCCCPQTMLIRMLKGARMTLLSDLLLSFLMALTVLPENTRARGKGMIQSREKIVVTRDDGTGVTEVPPAEHLPACSAALFAA